jgi:hypothetical protein
MARARPVMTIILAGKTAEQTFKELEKAYRDLKVERAESDSKDCSVVQAILISHRDVDLKVIAISPNQVGSYKLKMRHSHLLQNPDAFVFCPVSSKKHDNEMDGKPIDQHFAFAKRQLDISDAVTSMIVRHRGGNHANAHVIISSLCVAHLIRQDGEMTDKTEDTQKTHHEDFLDKIYFKLMESRLTATKTKTFRESKAVTLSVCTTFAADQSGSAIMALSKESRSATIHPTRTASEPFARPQSR